MHIIIMQALALKKSGDHRFAQKDIAQGALLFSHAGILQQPRVPPQYYTVID
jgi:hypothetical protein